MAAATGTREDALEGHPVLINLAGVVIGIEHPAQDNQDEALAALASASDYRVQGPLIGQAARRDGLAQFRLK